MKGTGRTLRRHLLEALLACALGVALGLLWDSSQARAANVEAEPVYSADGTDWISYGLCTATGGNHDACMMQHSTSQEAARWAGLTLEVCKIRLWPEYQAECAVSRAYIKQRWGY